jgi:hypothetical protein
VNRAPDVVHPVKVVGEDKLGDHSRLESDKELPGRVVVGQGRGGAGHVVAHGRPVLTGIAQQPHANRSEVSNRCYGTDFL